MKYRIVLTLYIVLVQGQVNRNFQLVLNEIGPGWTSRAWYFNSPAQQYIKLNTRAKEIQQVTPVGLTTAKASGPHHLINR